MKLPLKISWKLRFMNLPYKFGGILGLDFNGTILQEELGTDRNHCSAYMPANPAVKKVLKELCISQKDSILDVGCGKGKAMSYMLSFPFQRIDGLDISEKLIKVAERNFSILREKQRIALYICDARDFDGYDNYNYLFFYNPFPRTVMKVIKEHILESLRRFPRKMTIIYENPVDRDLFENGEFQWEQYVYDICPQPIVVYRYILHR